MIRIFTIFLAGFCAMAGTAMAQQAPQTVRAAVLRVDPPSLPPISRLDTRPGDLGFAGARLAIQDNDTTGRFMGQDFEAIEVAATPETAPAEMEKLLGQGIPFTHAGVELLREGYDRYLQVAQSLANATGAAR